MSIQSRIAHALAAASLAALVPAAGCAQIAEPTVAAIPGAAADVPFELFRGTRIVLQGEINGVRTPMILDSGAGVTTIDADFARRIGLPEGMRITAQGTGGDQEAELVQDVRLEVGNLRLGGVTVAVLDLDAIEKGIGRPIPVILGRELFMNSIVRLDFDGNMLSLSPQAGFAPPRGATEVRLRRDGTLHYLPVSIGGLPAEAALDLGNGGTLSISKEYADKAPALLALPHAIGFGGGVGGMHELRRVTVPKFEIAGFAFTGVPADLGTRPGGPYAGRANAGIQLFKPFRVTLDLGRDRMWLERTASAPRFHRDRAGLFLLLEDDHFNVLHVSPQGPAAKAGLKAGDRITAINRQQVGPGFYVSAQAEWAKAAPGTQVELARAGGGTVMLTLADFY
jgi:hypothetical protein